MRAHAAWIAMTFLIAPEYAHATDPVCKTSYVSGQQLRNKGKLREARADLVTCATSDCEDFIHADCIRWLAEVDDALPTVVIEVVTTDAVDIANARVSVDGSVFEEKMDGLAHPIDPGLHTFHVEAPGLSAPLDRDVLIHEGQKDQHVRLQVALANSPKKEPEKPLAQPTATSRPVPILTWILGGAGILAGGAGAVVVIDDIGRAQSYNDACPASGGTSLQCPADSASDVHRRALIGYGLIGVGVLLEVGAVTTYLLRPSKTVAVGFIESPRGISIFGSF